MAECDTLSDLPDEALSAEFIEHALFSQLRFLVGCVFAGNASAQFASMICGAEQSNSARRNLCN